MTFQGLHNFHDVSLDAFEQPTHRFNRPHDEADMVKKLGA